MPKFNDTCRDLIPIACVESLAFDITIDNPVNETDTYVATCLNPEAIGWSQNRAMAVSNLLHAMANKYWRES
jgi:hypothetical protein